MKRTPLTHQGAERLRAEAAHLKKVARPQIIAAIAEARAHGDLKENAEYHAAREQQGFTEGRIQQLESALSGAQIIDITKLNPGGKVVFGATVKLYDMASEAETSYQIVGELEADIKEFRIAITSPIARAMIGREEGDEIVVNAPAGELVYAIVSVEYV
ncbi:MAG: transcription elongation factor GreA [Gammaproteobacteria bacterium]|nr:MAG: transcription elongation factor GreA [Gammaproteobacteria bacterium]